MHRTVVEWRSLNFLDKARVRDIQEKEKHTVIVVCAKCVPRLKKERGRESVRCYAAVA